MKFSGDEFLETAPKFRKRKKNSSSCVYDLHKTCHQEISRPSCAVTAKVLYCTLVRSQVEYGSVVWSPHTSRNVDKLERKQRRGTKCILRKRNLTYEGRLNCLNLLSLGKRRYLFDVTFLYKALNGYLNVDVSPFSG